MDSQGNILVIKESHLLDIVERIVGRIEQKNGVVPKENWVNATTCKRLLGIKSDTTLQKFRDEGKIRHAKVSKKIIMYYLPSIEAFLEDNSFETF